MLKWTLRTPGDNLSCPPSPPNMNNVCTNGKRPTDIKVDLEDSNKCWYETRVKVAQVKSTSKVVQFSSKENVHFIENEEQGQMNTNFSIFKRWVSSPNTNEEFERRRKKHHKHIRCNALDPLRIFTGDITDSDTGSVYMKLDKTPAALVPKEMCVPSTGPYDPRRRPLVDISNGDYSDLRKHLQQMPPVSTSHQHPEQASFYEQLKPYKDLIIPNKDLSNQVSSSRIPVRPDPIGGSSSKLYYGEDAREEENPCNFSRARTQYVTATTTATTSITTVTSPTTVTSVYSSTPQMARYIQYEAGERELMRRRKIAKNSIWRKRHSIADIPSAFRRDNMFQASLEMQEQKCRRARVRHIRDFSGDSTLRGDNGSNLAEAENINRVKGRGETRNCNKIVQKEEPIYEKIKSPKDNCGPLNSTISCYEESLAESDLLLRRHFQTAYMTMQDLKDPLDQDSEDVLTLSRDDDYEICIYSSTKLSDKSKRAPIQFPEHHIYENAHCLTLSDSTILDTDDKTCDFTSVPQQNVHKPVAIKGSNDLIARFGKSPNDRQHPMPHYGLHISAEPSKKSCTKDAEHSNIPLRKESPECSLQRHYENLDFLNLHLHKSSNMISRYNSDPNIYKPNQFHKSTGQHVHVNPTGSLEVSPGLPLHNLRPPPPPPPFNQSYQPKLRKKSKSCIRLDANLPVIYELQKQEEEMDCRRERKYSTDLQSSYDSEETSKSSDILNYLNASPPFNSNLNIDNLDSGMSEGIHTPLISPMSGPPSPNSPRSDSLLGEAHTSLSIEDLQMYKENGYLIEENEEVESISMANFYKSNSAIYLNEQTNTTTCSKSEFNKILKVSHNNINDTYFDYEPFRSPHNQSTPIKPKLKDTLNNYLEGKIKNTEMSQLLHDAVEKNLFASETCSDYPFLNNSYKSVYNSSIIRRHSFASVKDISPKISQMDSHNDTSVWDVRNSSKKNDSCSLRKSHSFLSLSPATRKCQVSFTHKGVKERNWTVNGGGSPNLQGKGDTYWSGGDGQRADEEGRVSKRAGSGGKNGNVGERNSSVSPHQGMRRRRSERDSALKRNEGSIGREITVTPGSFPDVSENRSPDRGFPACLTSSLFPSSEGNSTLPGVMREEISGVHLVPPSQRLSKHAVESLQQTQNVEQKTADNLTEKQRRRHEESLFRLQCLLKEPPISDCEEDNLSGDWSLEAVLDEASCSRDFDSSPRSSLGSAGSRTTSDSLELQDTFSVCTLDSELADSVQFGSKLCDKIRQVSEEKMFAKLRRSFRKKEKYVPKVGIFMFVDNPMYVSPEVKKEAKIITFTPGKLRKSFRKKDNEKLEKELKEHNKNAWYVGNPMYNSPDCVKVKNKYSAMSNYSSDCQKENINNFRAPKSVVGANNNRIPLSDLWIQTNPCYDSPDLKTLNKIDSKYLNNKSPLKRKLYSPKNIKNKPLPSPPKQPPPRLVNIDSHYLTPIFANRLDSRPPAPTNFPNGHHNIPEIIQFIDHEYCTIPGEESDSWTSHSSHSKNSESSSARRSLKFGKNHKKYSLKSSHCEGNDPSVPQGKYFASKSPSVTPSRIWRETAKTQQSTPRKYQGTLEKQIESIPFGDRGYKTPRAVKRDRMIKDQTKKSFPPDLPLLPAPPLPITYSILEDTNAFHHRYPSENDTEVMESSSAFQLPPDSIYESLSFISRTQSTPASPTDVTKDNQRLSGIDYSVDQKDTFSHQRTNDGTKPDQRKFPKQRTLPDPPVEFRTSRTTSRTTSGVCSNCSSSSSLCSCSSPISKTHATSGVSSSSGISSSHSKCASMSLSCKRKSRSRVERVFNSSRSGMKTPTGNVKRTPKRSLPKKYKAREVLQGKGQLKLEVYENFGLLTIHIIEARRLRSNFSSLCNPYAKISLVPDNLERTFCRTPLLKSTNTPIFNQKFSFDFLPEDLDKRLLISLWNRDTQRKRSEFLGCMTFSVAHITTKRVSGWFRLLTEAVGRRKHFAVSFLNGSLDNSRKLGDIVMEDDKTQITSKVPELDNCQLPSSVKALPEYQNCPNPYLNSNNNPPLVTPNTQVALGQTPYTITVNIQRNKDGFGFSVAWTRPPRVERVEPGKAADLAGLRPGDYIIFVGHQNVVKLDENSVLNVIRECGDRLPLEVYRRGVSRTPKTLTNGWARPPSIAPADSNAVGQIGCDVLKKNKVGHVTFSHENSTNILDEKFIHLLTSEQRFCINCRFCVERYLIPLRFRVDIITPSAHAKLFTSIEQILDITETIVDRTLDNEDENCFANLGLIYNSVIDHLVEGYVKYFKGISEADSILSKFLKDIDFVDLLQNPPVPKRSPDITTLIHLPCAHFREVIALIEDIVAVATGRHDFYILREIYEKLWRVYKDATSASTKEIKNNIPPSPIPPMSPQNRNFSPARKPLLSVLDIENRLVFTKQMTPIRLSNGSRKWLFGSELSRLEGRNLKQYWVMLFTDLLLITSVNRDRVIYVMDDPIPLEAIIDADFHIKKKVMDFRLSVDTSFDISSIAETGDSTSYLSGTTSGSNSRSSTLSSRGRPKRSKARGRRYVVFRAPSVALKTTWESLIYRQIYACHRSSEQKSQLARVYGLLSPSLFRAGSQDGTVTRYSFHVSQNRSESCDDLRPSAEDIFESTGERINPHLECAQPHPRIQSFRVYDLEPRGQSSLTSDHLSKETLHPTKEILHVPVVTVENYDETSTRSELKETENCKSKLDGERSQTKVEKELRNQETENNLIQKDAAKEEEKRDFELKDLNASQQLQKKKKSITEKYKHKLFSYRNQPPRKTENRVTKVAKYVNSLHAADISDERSVTPLFDHEENLNKEDFLKKRTEMLRNKPPSFSEGEEIIIVTDYDASLQSEKLSNEIRLKQTLSSANQHKMDSGNYTKKEENVSFLKIKCAEKDLAQFRNRNQDLLITPEDYEEYLDGRIEKDYPELEETPPTRSYSKTSNNEANKIVKANTILLDSTTLSGEKDTNSVRNFRKVETGERNLNKCASNKNQILDCNFSKCELKVDIERSVLPHHPAGPLSGSSSMSFMDETTPTSTDGSCDFYQRTTKSTTKALDKSTLSKTNSSLDNVEMPRASFDSSSSESLNDCINVSGANLVCKASLPKIFPAYRQDSSASLGNAVTICSNESSNSSMSISSTSVGSNHIPPKPRSILFIPAKNANSLPEISLQPPTPQAPKPRENYDAENKIAYDLKVPGYSSMFLTVPGFDDYDEDRYLPGTKYDARTDSETSDDDIVHKPRAFASLIGVAKKRGLKSYGSSCDLSKFGLSSPSDTEEATAAKTVGNHDDDRVNGNLPLPDILISEGEGAIPNSSVVDQMIVFEKVADEERHNSQDQLTKPRIVGKNKKSEDYIESGGHGYPSRFKDSHYEVSKISTKNSRRNGTQSAGILSNLGDYDSTEYLKNNKTERHLKRQSKIASNSNLRSKDPETAEIQDGNYQEYPGLLNASLEDHTEHRKEYFARSYSNDDSSHIGVKRCYQPIPPIIRRMQSADSQGSPSRVRFSPVTDVYFRSSPESSDREDGEENLEKNKESGEQESSFKGIDTFNIDKDNRTMLQEASSLSSLSKEIEDKNMESPKLQKENSFEKSPRKRFSLFRSPKKETNEAEKSMSSNKPSKGKRLAFSKGITVFKSSREDLTNLKKSISEDERFL